ncbi:hypothetical protein FOXB_17330 [Fusarium oxysporum f. sp. conglutinans Fo5176]|uniref:HAT C-terminal dimerisation domain-containing protein n=1 Tax=Fusarium oxysporum (strain Fo5176) TaxID=660025 RepID=F9GF96_FUSOF|nr:hypothetical protein FOXB_17330 [Fusarium oxysporum f. sp. conglutinans Fo5176]
MASKLMSGDSTTGTAAAGRWMSSRKRLWRQRHPQAYHERHLKLAKTTAMGSELERYLRLEPQETEDPIEWWMARQGQFPMISQRALDILAIPAMATDCERSFSLAKLTLTSQRLSMTTETLEKLQCLKNWVRHGAVKLGATADGKDELQWEIGNSSMENTDVEI